jgi:hypothetical protein
MEKPLQAPPKETMPEAVLKEGSTALEARRIDLDRLLTDAEEPPSLLRPEMATYYRER